MAFDSGSRVVKHVKAERPTIPSSLMTRVHRGIVLDVSLDGFDKAGACFGSIFFDLEEPNILYLFYTGTLDVEWSQAAIGLAISRDGFEFRKIGKSPILEGMPGSFCHQKALVPAVTRIGNRFYMIFSGSSVSKPSRRIGIAYADDIKGPWHIIGELIKPSRLWEGDAIDNGPSLVKLDDETILVYYSSITSPKVYDVFTRLRGYPVRRIGILKLRIRGTSLSSIEALRFQGNPLKHLNGKKGSWNESLFCPGYLQLNNVCYLFPAASTYSLGFSKPSDSIGVVTGNSPYFDRKTSKIERLIDGRKEKSQIIPLRKGELELDTPAPYVNWQEKKLFLYYSVVDQADRVWKTALTIFNLDSKSKNDS